MLPCSVNTSEHLRMDGDSILSCGIRPETIEGARHFERFHSLNQTIGPIRSLLSVRNSYACAHMAGRTPRNDRAGTALSLGASCEPQRSDPMVPRAPGVSVEFGRETPKGSALCPTSEHSLKKQFLDVPKGNPAAVALLMQSNSLACRSRARAVDRVGCVARVGRAASKRIETIPGTRRRVRMVMFVLTESSVLLSTDSAL
jgi:hypothetical protein